MMDTRALGCIHEFFAFDNGVTSQSIDHNKTEGSSKSKDKCPIALGKAKAKEAVEISQSSNIETSIQGKIPK